MKHKKELKEAAIKLRLEEKLGLKDISLRLNISKATASVWLRDIKLDKELILKRTHEASTTPEAKLKTKRTWREKFENTSFEESSIDSKRMKVFEEQKYSCNNCKLKIWMDRSITLELEHKDGNTSNNVRDNLEALCPNCHALTNTWRGRNKRTTKVVTDQELIEALKSERNTRQALLKVGLVGKGNNYNRAKQLVVLHNIERIK
jgi:5-methylcytosine-specific restriction endonuclease McrA